MGKKLDGWGSPWNCPFAVGAQPLWDQGTAQMWMPREGMSMAKDASGRDVHGKGMSMGRNTL